MGMCIGATVTKPMGIHVSQVERAVRKGTVVGLHLISTIFDRVSTQINVILGHQLRPRGSCSEIEPVQSLHQEVVEYVTRSRADPANSHKMGPKHERAFTALHFLSIHID
jgi:hypothetical protein